VTVRGLYAIADTAILAPAALQAAVAAAIDGGARLIQYRDKGGDAAARRVQAEALGRLCSDRRVPLVVNDDVALARGIGAAGVHLGRGDSGLTAARQVLGPKALIGVSCYNELDRAVRAQNQGADYVAFGSFFSSPTKPNAVRADLALLRTARRTLRVPIVAIGGITPANVPALIEAGADAVAVISGVFAQPDIEAAARRYVELFE
jgi:thiamine-phosphate pyrophosphorylase